MESTPVIELDGVTKRYGDTKVLENVDLGFASGQTTVLIGPSGCGKSTLLRLVVGLVEADAGEVRFEGEILSPCNIQQLRRRMGYVIQEGGLFPHLTAAGNTTLMARRTGMTDAQIRERLHALAELTQLPTETLDRYPAELSGGQRQRVSLLRALMLDPDVLLMDEPLGALDPMIRAELQEQLREIFVQLDKTVVLVTHDLDEAAYFADRVVLLRAGRIEQQGRVTELLNEPKSEFVTAFVQAQRSVLETLRGTPEA